MSSSLDQTRYWPILIEPSRILINQIAYPSSLTDIGESMKRALLGIPPSPVRSFLMIL